jgi:organic hydroperoxide reductase OsmC/OhrA
MKSLPHIYTARTSGAAEGHALVESSGVPGLRVALPVDYEGPGGAWSPGQLLIAAVEACFLFTFHAVAQASNFEFAGLEVSGEGAVDRQAGTTRFTEIVLRPRLILRATSDRARALRILEKSERSCLIAASLSTPVRLEPEISTA